MFIIKKESKIDTSYYPGLNPPCVTPLNKLGRLFDTLVGPG